VKPSDHVDLLGVLFSLWGCLTLIIGLSTLALGVGALVLATTSATVGSDVGAGLTATVFMVLALIAVAWGAVHVVVGRGLRRHVLRARLAAIVLGVVDLLILPYGTALGGYALWVLLGESRRKMFSI
jgi:hypothetical protein